MAGSMDAAWNRIFTVLAQKKQAEREDAIRQQAFAREDMLRQQDIEREDALRQEAYERQSELQQRAAAAAMEQMQAKMQAEQASKLELEQRALATDMYKQALEDRDLEQATTFGAALRERGFPVMGQEQAGPPIPGGEAPFQYGVTPGTDYSDMKELELISLASQGDPEAAKVLEGLTAFKQATRGKGTSVTVHSGAKAMTKMGEEMAKSLIKEREDVQGAVAGLRSMRGAKELIDSGIITGTGANFRVALGKALTTIGFKKSDDAVTNSQAFAAVMGNQVAQVIKAFGAGTGLSNEDRRYATKIAGGDITVDEKAIKWLLKANETAYKNLIKGYNKKAEQAMSMPGADQLPYDLRIAFEDEEEKKPAKKTAAAKASPDKPPVAGARQSADGNWWVQKDGAWWVQKDGKWYRGKSKE